MRRVKVLVRFTSMWSQRSSETGILGFGSMVPARDFPALTRQHTEAVSLTTLRRVFRFIGAGGGATVHVCTSWRPSEHCSRNMVQ